MIPAAIAAPASFILQMIVDRTVGMQMRHNPSAFEESGNQVELHVPSAHSVRSDSSQARSMRDAHAGLRIINLSEWDPHWNWLEPTVQSRTPLEWIHASTQSVKFLGWRPRSRRFARAAAAWSAASMLHSSPSMLVSHGPRMTAYGALALRARLTIGHHLAYSFNFTKLPEGGIRKLMALAFSRVDRFVCYSNMERSLYAGHFDLDIDRIDMIHWSARPPSFAEETPNGATDYICAIGTQGRDYETLMQAMRRLPRIRLVVVASATALDGIQIPDNVEVHCNIPLAKAMGILGASRFTIVPLSGRDVPCGHVTIVNAMHGGKAIVASDSAGITDYIEHETNGLLVPVRDGVAMAQAIERLWTQTGLSTRLASAAKTFASRCCTEQRVASYLEAYLRRFDDHVEAAAAS